MSYDVYVFDPAGVALPDLAAVKDLLDAEEGDDDAELSPPLKELVAHLEAAFPAGDDLEGTPWASWPLDQPVAGGYGLVINLVFSGMADGLLTVMPAARARGLAIYDPQTDELVQAKRRRWFGRR